MADQLSQQAAPVASTPSNAGSVFGLDTDTANSPLLLAHPQYDAAHPTSWGAIPHTQPVTGTVLDGVSAFYHFSAPDRADAVSQLIAAGYLDPNDAGKPAKAYSAWRQAVIDASRSGMTIPEILSAGADQFAAAGGGGSTRAPLVTKLTNPEDLKKGLHDYFRKTLGKGAIPDDKIDAMVAAYHSQEAAYQQAAYDAEQDGGTATSPMDFQTFADIQARKTDPTAYDSNKVLDQFNVIHQMLSGQGVPSGS